MGKSAPAPRPEGLAGVQRAGGVREAASLPLLILSPPRERLAGAGRGFVFRTRPSRRGSSDLPASEISNLPLLTYCVSAATSGNLNRCRGFAGCQGTCVPASKNSLCWRLCSVLAVCLGHSEPTFFLKKLRKTTCFLLFLISHDSRQTPDCCTLMWPQRKRYLPRRVVQHQ